MKNIIYLLFVIFPFISNGQFFTKLTIKMGPNISGQKKTPKLFVDGGNLIGASCAIEPIIVTFGSKKQFDFNTDSTTFGMTYGFGVCFVIRKVRFISELLGQNDFTNSSYYDDTGQTFRNFSYILNFGVTISLNKQDK